MKTFKIAQVRTILNIDRPIVVLEVLGNEPIIRTPKELLTDMQNSGRALAINPNDFKHGYEFVSQGSKALFIQCALDCIGAEVTGNIVNNKAGDTYLIEAGHPALTDTTHKLYGSVKEGDSAIIEKDGVRVEGFLSIPLTQAELYRRDITATMANSMLAIMGLGVQAPAQANTTAYAEPELGLEDVDVVAKATQEEAFGKTAKPAVETAK